ncbi:uncharacterized protein LOC144829499 [Lissotriton helveticus]
MTPEYKSNRLTKGGAIVIRNRQFYESNVIEHISDSDTYLKLDDDPIKELTSTLDSILEQAENMQWITKKTRQFLTVSFPKQPGIYMLPKIHKDQAKPPFRPIVTGCGTIFEPLGQYIDHFLQPFVQSWYSYTKDTTHFLQKLANIPFETGMIMCTLDVKALYTSIPHVAGIEAVEWALLKQDELSANKVFLLELLHFCLHHSYFKWDNEFYLQNKGTSMGFSGAPAYANTYMAKYEETFLLKDKDWVDNIILYCRYIDDIFLIWQNSQELLEQKILQLNTYDENIEFTKNIETKAIPFLDVLVKIEDNAIQTEVYHKTTDKNTALMFNSFHSRNLVNNLPYSQMLRVKRICSDNEALESNLDMITTKYIAKKYPKILLEKTREKVQDQARELLLKNKAKPTETRQVFVSKYSTSTNEIKRSNNRHWELLSNEPDFKELFVRKPIFAYKSSQNIKELLKPKPRGIQTIYRGTRKCQNCVQCNNVIVTNTVKHPYTGETIITKHNADCNTMNVIYAIKCPCGLLYIGKMERKVKTRISEHKSTIRNKNPNSSLAVHWDLNRHSIAQVKFQVLEVVVPAPGKNNTKCLLQREVFWIKRLDTQDPKGINDRVDLGCYL